ncbi:MAG: hypothetical protein ACUVRU_07920, partial [Anaerolineae bacterium]
GFDKLGFDKLSRRLHSPVRADSSAALPITVQSRLRRVARRYFAPGHERTPSCSIITPSLNREESLPDYAH